MNQMWDAPMLWGLMGSRRFGKTHMLQSQVLVVRLSVAFCFVFLRSLLKSTKLCLSKYGKWRVGARHNGRFLCESRGDEKHTPHLDDTDLVGLDHNLPKLCGDQDLTLLGD